MSAVISIEQRADTIEVLYDPTSGYHRGNLFRKWDFMVSLEVWPSGMFVRDQGNGQCYILDRGGLEPVADRNSLQYTIAKSRERHYDRRN